LQNDAQHFQHLADAWDLFLDAGPANRQFAASVRWSQLADRFRNLSGCNLRVLQARRPPGQIGDAPPPGLRCPDCPLEHPLCATTWQAHIKALDARRGGVWHRCPCGRLCALFTSETQDNGRRPVLTRLVSDREVAESLFVSQLELAGLLAAIVDHLGAPEDAIEERPAPALEVAAAARSPLLRRTLTCIEEHLGDPKLTVRGVAALLNVNPSYLAHLFARQLGMRMTKYIAARRIERSKSLLVTSDLCVKRVAYRCGFSSASWFGQLFRSTTGLTPGQYRRRHTGR
jgi:AraC-like DNA-binding protein